MPDNKIFQRITKMESKEKEVEETGEKEIMEGADNS